MDSTGDGRHVVGGRSVVGGSPLSSGGSGSPRTLDHRPTFGAATNSGDNPIGGGGAGGQLNNSKTNNNNASSSSNSIAALPAEEAMRQLIEEYSHISGFFRMRYVFFILALLGIALFADFSVLARQVLTNYLDDSGRTICTDIAANVQNQMNLFRLDVSNMIALMSTYPQTYTPNAQGHFEPSPTVVDVCSLMFGGVLAFSRYDAITGNMDLYRECPGKANLLKVFNESIGSSVTPNYILRETNTERYLETGSNVVYVQMGYPFTSTLAPTYRIMITKQVFGTLLFSADSYEYSTATLLRDTAVGVFLAPKVTVTVKNGTTVEFVRDAAAGGTAVIHTLTSLAQRYDVEQPTSLATTLNNAFVDSCHGGAAHTWYSSMVTESRDALLGPMPQPFIDGDSAILCGTTCVSTVNSTTPVCNISSTQDLYVVVKTVIRDSTFSTILSLANVAAIVDIVLIMTIVLSLFVSLGAPAYLLNRKIRSILTGIPMRRADKRNKMILMTSFLWINDMTSLLHIFHVMAAFFVNNRKYVPPYILHRQISHLRQSGQLDQLMKDAYDEDDDEDENEYYSDDDVENDIDDGGDADSGNEGRPRSEDLIENGTDDRRVTGDASGRGTTTASSARAPRRKRRGSVTVSDEQLMQKAKHDLDMLLVEGGGSGGGGGGGGGEVARQGETTTESHGPPRDRDFRESEDASVGGPSSILGRSSRRVSYHTQIYSGGNREDMPHPAASQYRRPSPASGTTTVAMTDDAPPRDSEHGLTFAPKASLMIVQLHGIEDAFVCDFILAERQHRRVLAAINSVIRRHRGEPFERTGDRVSVAWNAFDARSDHALRAVRCAMDIASLFRQFRRDGLRMGIVVHQGPVVCGVVGDRREAASVLFGQTADQAVRIAALAAQLPYFNVVVTEPVKQAVSIFFECVIVDVVRVASTTTCGERSDFNPTLSLYDVRGVDALNNNSNATSDVTAMRAAASPASARPPKATGTQSAFAVEYNAAFTCFKAHAFRDALVNLGNLQKSHPNDPLIVRLATLCLFAELQKRRPLSDADPTSLPMTAAAMKLLSPTLMMTSPSSPFPDPYGRLEPKWELYEELADSAFTTDGREALSALDNLATDMYDQSMLMSSHRRLVSESSEMLFGFHYPQLPSPSSQGNGVNASPVTAGPTTSRTTSKAVDGQLSKTAFDAASHRTIHSSAFEKALYENLRHQQNSSSLGGATPSASQPNHHHHHHHHEESHFTKASPPSSVVMHDTPAAAADGLGETKKVDRSSPNPNVEADKEEDATTSGETKKKTYDVEEAVRTPGGGEGGGGTHVAAYTPSALQHVVEILEFGDSVVVSPMTGGVVNNTNNRSGYSSGGYRSSSHGQNSASPATPGSCTTTKAVTTARGAREGVSTSALPWRGIGVDDAAAATEEGLVVDFKILVEKATTPDPQHVVATDTVDEDGTLRPLPSRVDKDDEDDSRGVDIMPRQQSFVTADSSSAKGSLVRHRSTALRQTLIDSVAWSFGESLTNAQHIPVVQPHSFLTSAVTGETSNVVDEHPNITNTMFASSIVMSVSAIAGQSLVMRQDIRDFPQQVSAENGATYVRSSRILGTGSFGCVYMGMEQHTSRLVAMKFLPLPSDEAEVRVLQNEVVTMETVTDANLVEFYGYAFVDNMIVLMMECMVAGSLASMLSTFATLPEQTTINFMRDVLRGLHRLHSMGIVHRDVKPQNVLIAANGHCKISDFGASASIHELVRRHDGGAEVQGTPIYLAPEAARGHAEPKSDVWSVGIMYLQLTTGKIPYDASVVTASIGQVVFGIGSGRMRPVIPADLNPMARAFVEGCLVSDVKLRWSAAELLELPLFCV